MATTTTAFNGTNVSIQYQGHDGVMTFCQGDMNEFAFEGSSDIGDYAVFKDDWKYKLVGKKDSTLTINIVNSLGANTTFEWAQIWWDQYHDQARYIIIDYPQHAVGAKRLAGYFVLETLPIGASADEPGPMMTQLSMQSTGEVVLSTVAT